MDKYYLNCWSCNKKHDGSLYDKWFKEKRTYYCECGGVVISNSGKIMGGINDIDKRNKN